MQADDLLLDDLLLDDLFADFNLSSDDEFDLSSKWEPTGDDEMDAIAEDIFNMSLSTKLSMAHTTLIKECVTREPGAFLSEILQKQLEAFTDEQRQEIVNRPFSGFTPLVIACMRGHIRIVGYLIKRCGASIEPKDVKDSEDLLSEEEPNGKYAPLWISISFGQLKIVKYLLKRGADVNTVFEKGDTGYTPLLVACFKGRFNVAKLLIEKGANIHCANFEGETCLMGALECVPLLEYLIEKGVDVNAQDHYLNTPLHYAIELHQLEAVRLLLKSGADPYIKNNHGDDSLQFACLNGTVHIVDCLHESCTFSKERILDTCELLGATYLYDFQNMSIIMDIWGKAIQLRRAYNLPKQASAIPKWAYLNATEFASKEELNSIAYDLDALRMQSLLIHERILGQTHMRTICRIWQQVNIYKDGHEYSRCITLMKYAFTLRIQVDCLLWQGNAFFLNDLDTLFADIHYDLTREYPRYEVQYTDVYEVIDLIGSQLASCKKLLQVKPVFEDHLVNFNEILKNLTNLITILVVKSETPAQMVDSVNLLRRIRQIDPRDSFGNTLLHLAVFQTTNRSANHCLFLCKCLLDAGFSINQVTDRLKTPLHLVSTSVNYNANVVDLFLSKGAHIDQKDLAGNQPAKQLAELSPLYVNPLKYLSLKCLAASVVSKTGKVLLPGTVPAHLMKFISQH